MATLRHSQRSVAGAFEGVKAYEEEGEPEDDVVRLMGLRSYRFSKAQTKLQLDEAATSVYRWWFEFLRLSQDYWYLCYTTKSGSPRTGDARLARVYRDFGDVHRLSFREWWLARGVELFKEELPSSKVRVIESSDPALRMPVDQVRSVLLEVPLGMTRGKIERAIRDILEQFREYRPSTRFESSHARYPINPTRFKRPALQTTHEVYCLHRALLLDPDRPRAPGVNQFRVGKILHLNRKAERLIGPQDEIARRKNIMGATVGRYLSRAADLVANVEIGRFPSLKPVDPVAKRFTKAQREERDALQAEWFKTNLFSELSFYAVNDLVQREGLPTLRPIVGLK